MKRQREMIHEDNCKIIQRIIKAPGVINKKALLKSSSSSQKHLSHQSKYKESSRYFRELPPILQTRGPQSEASNFTLKSVSGKDSMMFSKIDKISKVGKSKICKKNKKQKNEEESQFYEKGSQNIEIERQDTPQDQEEQKTCTLRLIIKDQSSNILQKQEFLLESEKKVTSNIPKSQIESSETICMEFILLGLGEDGNEEKQIGILETSLPTKKDDQSDEKKDETKNNASLKFMNMIRKESDGLFGTNQEDNEVKQDEKENEKEKEKEKENEDYVEIMNSQLEYEGLKLQVRSFVV